MTEWVIVADSSPLIGLARIGQLEILHNLASTKKNGNEGLGFSRNHLFERMPTHSERTTMLIVPILYLQNSNWSMAHLEALHDHGI